MARYARGFTLLELLMVLGIGAVLLTLGVPAWQTLVERVQVGHWQRQLHGALNYTRGSAIHSGTPTTICARGPDGGCAAQGGNWHRGWLVFEDSGGHGDCHPNAAGNRCQDSGARILRVNAGPEDLRIVNNHNIALRVRYNAMGLSYGYTGRFTVCARQGDVADKGLVIANTGRIRSTDPDELLECPPQA
jgi:type IV fimbrial biogenesis protein FimT